MLQWVYSKVQYFSEYLSKWDETLAKDIEEKEQIEKFIKQLESPFGFLDNLNAIEANDTEENEGGANQPQSQLEAIVKEQEKKIKAQEQIWEREFDNVSTSIAVKLGFSHVPWFTLTKIVLTIQTILTVFVLFFRTDFVNLTVCAGGIYMIYNTDRIQKWTFRVLVFGIFLSLIYDIIWFYLQDQSSDNADGGVERSVRNFSLTVSYFSFFFRVR